MFELRSRQSCATGAVPFPPATAGQHKVQPLPAEIGTASFSNGGANWKKHFLEMHFRLI
jgi:hypothetical protein